MVRIWVIGDWISLDKFMEMLIKTNDKAASNIAAGNMKDALYLLEKMERILEVGSNLSF